MKQLLLSAKVIPRALPNSQMTLQEALRSTGVAEAYHDGYTVCVQDDEEDYTDGYRLSIQVAAMPPHFSKFCRQLEDVQKELDTSFLSSNLDWTPVETEDSEDENDGE